MCKLTYEELILLDNLIYLEWDAKEDEKLMDLVQSLLENEDFDDLMEKMGNCIIKMTHSEWMTILEQIKNKPNLKTLIIKNIDTYKSGMKFACFIDDQSNATVVFRGTTTSKEWEDNGQGAYEYDTIEQINALNYINNLEYNNITVTGHSKGGNKAQYVTVLSSKIAECISVNGQGFSNEFIDKYKEKINENQSKIISINSKYDYVNCLFNSIAGKCHYIKTELQINPIYYHKANILLDINGELRQETNEGIFSKIMNSYSLSLISNLADEPKTLIIDVMIGVIELILCKEKNKDAFLKMAGEILIMLCYENYVKNNKIFNITYVLLQALSLPLLFWEDFIKVEETNSQELLEKIVTNINILRTTIIKRLEIIDKSEMSLIESISNVINDLTYKLENESIYKLSNVKF